MWARGGLLTGLPRERRNGVIGADATAFYDGGNYTLFAIFHQFTKARRERVHLVTGIARLDEAEYGLADLDVVADQRNEIDADGFDLGTGLAGLEVGDAEGGGVLLEDLALDEGDLAFGWLAGAAGSCEVALVFLNTFIGDEVELVGAQEGLAGDGWVDVE